jgi:site-specific recombinase XerD
MNFIFFLSAGSADIKNIHLQIIDDKNGLSFKFFTHISISEREWDKEKQRPNNIYLKKHKKINILLDHIKVQLNTYLEQRILYSKQVTQRGISRELYKAVNNKNFNYQENSLLGLMQLYILSRKELICHSTSKRYSVFFNLIRRFEGHSLKHFIIEDVNPEFINNFLNFGKTEEYSENTLIRTIHFIKTILNFAERKGKRTLVRELEIRKGKQQQELVTLNEEEIRAIKYVYVPADLQPAKDWLLVSCYTGQRISDFMNFSWEKLVDINEKTCITFTQQKTQKKITLPLHPIVLNIIKNNNNSFPPRIEPTQYNQQIKQIARIAGLKTRIKANKRTGYRVRNMTLEKWQLLTSHIGRRSFATNFYGKIPTSLLIEATGHSTEQMFLRYINKADNNLITSLGNYFEKIYKKSSEI